MEGLMDVEEPERRSLTFLRKQTASGEAEELVAGHDGGRALAPLLSLLSLPRLLFFCQYTHVRPYVCLVVTGGPTGRI